MSVCYEEFLASKDRKCEAVGFEVESTNPRLFGWQADIVRWACRRGRAALFADCGMGKTPMQLSWADAVCGQTNGDVLVLAPLAVSAQTQREGAKFDVGVTVCREPEDVRPGINVTNYERLDRFKGHEWAGVVLDESSILKGFDGKFRKDLTEYVRTIHYRLACTATPAPNDLTELTNHAEFLDIMTGKEIIALFFRQDGNTTHAWRLKGHARQPFWKWLGEWSVACRKPSDLGFEDGAFVLPALRFHEHVVKSAPMPGELFVREAATLNDQRKARRDSMGERVRITADLVNADKEPWLVWCDLNAESEALAAAIPGAVEVKGSDTTEHKEKALLGFATGDVRVLVTKPSIAGHGMNYQHCHNAVFVGVSHSYEMFYQAVRRCWRFGQTRPVDVHIVISEAEGAVLDNIRRKEKQASEMFDELVKHMAVYSDVSRAAHRNQMVYEARAAMALPSWM